jgi:hypothetical protein
MLVAAVSFSVPLGQAFDFVQDDKLIVDPEVALT